MCIFRLHQYSAGHIIVEKCVLGSTWGLKQGADINPCSYILLHPQIKGSSSHAAGFQAPLSFSHSMALLDLISPGSLALGDSTGHTTEMCSLPDIWSHKTSQSFTAVNTSTQMAEGTLFWPLSKPPTLGLRLFTEQKLNLAETSPFGEMGLKIFQETTCS